MPAAPTPPRYEHPPAFLEALGLDDPHHDSSAWDMVSDLAREFDYGPDHRQKYLPSWCHTPGSAEGLAALRAIMEALGYSLIGSYWCSGPATLMIADSHFSFAYGPGIPGSSFGVIAKWADPTALPRLLHLALALAPEAPHA